MHLKGALVQGLGAHEPICIPPPPLAMPLVQGSTLAGLKHPAVSVWIWKVN